MEINKENKAKFFAQYYGQKVLNIRRNDSPVLYVGFDDMQNNNVKDDDYLELKPLSSISDEDAKDICLELGLVNAEKKCIGENFITYNDDRYSVRFYYEGLVVVQQYLTILHADTKKANDIAVSKGYYIQWMGIAAEKAIQAGWIKTEGGE